MSERRTRIAVISILLTVLGAVTSLLYADIRDDIKTLFSTKADKDVMERVEKKLDYAIDGIDEIKRMHMPHGRHE